MSAQKTKQSQKGFTLIELIAVMVILGLLAVVAIPKYVNLQKEAAEAQVAGVVGAMNSALALNYAKLAVGMEGADNITKFSELRAVMSVWPQDEAWNETPVDTDHLVIEIGGQDFVLHLEEQNFAEHKVGKVTFKAWGTGGGPIS